MRRLVLATLLALPSFAFGCSSSGDTGSTAPQDDAGDMTDTGMDDSTPADDSGASMEAATPDTAPAAAPKAPSVTAVMQMQGALHVTWKLNDTSLNNVEVWRKDGAGAYAKVYTLPGSALSQHDTQATNKSVTYCYQVKTIRAGMESALSNEKCGSP
jgi:hypothetical protein